MQLAVSPCQDEGILLKRKGGWDQQSMSNQDSDGEGSKYGPRTRQSKALVIEGSDLGNKKQSIDLRHFQAGPRGRIGEGKWGSALVRQQLHPHVLSVHMALAHLYGG